MRRAAERTIKSKQHAIEHHQATCHVQEALLRLISQYHIADFFLVRIAQTTTKAAMAASDELLCPDWILLNNSNVQYVT
jgi:hypothetical protein